MTSLGQAPIGRCGQQVGAAWLRCPRGAGATGTATSCPPGESPLGNEQLRWRLMPEVKAEKCAAGLAQVRHSKGPSSLWAAGSRVSDPLRGGPASTGESPGVRARGGCAGHCVGWRGCAHVHSEAQQRSRPASAAARPRGHPVSGSCERRGVYSNPET